MPAKRQAKSPLTILHADSLGFPWLIHGFSTRGGGSSGAYGGATLNLLNLGFTQHDSRAAVERNRAALLRQLGAARGNELWPLVTLRQIHSDIIHWVSQACISPLRDNQFLSRAGRGRPASINQMLVGDGLITSTPGLLLAIQAADCLPVILVDSKRRAVGVFHAGWRGTVKRIAEKGVGEMRGCFGTRPRDIQAAIGPGVHNCCYEVGPEVKEQFESQFAYTAKLFREVKEFDPVRHKYPMLFLTARPPGHGPLEKKIFLDLVEANRRQLMDAGVSAKNIAASPLCTACRTDLLFSYRAEKGNTGRSMGVVGIRP